MPDEWWPDAPAGAMAVPPGSFSGSGTRGGTTTKRGSYRRTDMAALFAAGLEVTPPTILYRTDMECLFYAGTVNSVIGESESGKTWMTLLAAYQEIRAKRRVLFIDFEDMAIRVVKRLMLMGITEAEILEFFDYIQPEGTFGDEQREEFIEFGIAEYSLVVMDGVTEAMSLHGLDGRQENDIATFYELLPKWISAQGPAVVLIDHVPKSKENRGGYAIGSQHKKAGITGASYTVESKEPMGKGRHGKSYISLAKDKLGGVDYIDGPSNEKRFIGTLHVISDATMDFDIEARIEPKAIGAAPSMPATGAFVPSKEFTLRKEATDIAKREGKPLSRTRIRNSMRTGNNATRMAAVDYLITYGFLVEVLGGVEYARDYDASELAASA